MTWSRSYLQDKSGCYVKMARLEVKGTVGVSWNSPSEMMEAWFRMVMEMERKSMNS